MHLTCMPLQYDQPMNRYEEPLGADRLQAEQPEERARLCDRLETMWQGIQADIEYARETAERGVDPRHQQLQLQIVKLQAQLWRMLVAPMPEPPEQLDPEEASRRARDEVEEKLQQLQELLGE